MCPGLVKPEINEKNGKLVPVIELQTLEQYIKEPFGNGQFKLAKSLSRSAFIIKYYVSGKILGTAEVLSFESQKNETYVMLYSSNISGAVEAFASLFQEISGKIINKEVDLPFFTIFSGIQGAPEKIGPATKGKIAFFCYSAFHRERE